ncbi:MAG: hemerythrin domain-containing protein [Marinicaulis sp.]|nr:hemerythrin domain-containing protein [Marinicaulis sp.]
MDIYRRLKADHDTQRNLFEQIASTEGESDQRKVLWSKLKVELEAHAAAEEQTFYAELMTHPDATEQSRHSVAEHQEASDLIAEIDDIDMSSSAWLQKCKHLKDRVLHHVEEEEDEVFPKAKTMISKSRSEELANEFNDRKPAEKKERSAA